MAEALKLTKAQWRLLRALDQAAFGIELGGSWVGTGGALVRRGLASGSRSFISITDAGRAAVSANPSSTTRGGSDA